MMLQVSFQSLAERFSYHAAVLTNYSVLPVLLFVTYNQE